MSIQAILKQCVEQNIVLSAEGQSLQISGATKSIPAELIAQLKEHKQELVSFLNGFTSHHSKELPIPKVSDRDSYPLSPAQRGLWAYEKIVGPNDHYNMANAFWIEGDFDPDSTKTVLDWLLEKHPVLASTFYDAEDGNPMAKHVNEYGEYFTVKHFDHLPEAEAEQAIRDFLIEEANAPFDLSTEIKLRAGCLKLSNQKSAFYFTLHHAAADGWSIEILSKDFAIAFEQLKVKGSLPYIDSDLGYEDYCHWINQKIESGDYQAQVDYWQAHLNGAPDIHDLPLDRPRTANGERISDYKTLKFSHQESELLRASALQQKCTLFMYMHGVISTLLSRFSQKEDIVIGTPMAGRDQSQLENVVGFFINTVLLRTHAENALSFDEYMSQVKDVNIAAQSNQNVPFDYLVELLNPVRSNSHNPLFQIMFTQNKWDKNDAGSDVEMQAFNSAVLKAKYDLQINLVELNEGNIQLSFAYNTDIFSDNSIRNLLNSCRLIANQVTKNPQLLLGELALSTKNEKETLISHGTIRQQVNELPIGNQVEAIAKAYPNKLALSSASSQFTYAELLTNTNILVDRLSEFNLRHQTKVGLQIDKSPELVMAMLACLKAGYIYVPIDPSNPADRIEYILKDSECALILSHSDSAISESNVLTLNIDNLLDPDAQVDVSTAERSLSIVDKGADMVTSNDGAYVIYTSGTTGNPKGALVSHRNISSLVNNTNYVSLSEQDNLAFLSNPNFDAATFEVWGALCSGATLHFLSDDVLLNGEKFEEAIHQHKLTTVFITTALFNQIAQTHPSCFSSLQTLMFGGEASDPGSIKKILEHGRPSRLINIYGPTENTTFSTFYEITKEMADYPIGNSIAGNYSYIVNDNLELLEPGMVGELCLGGEGICKGYLNRPELNKEKFVTLELPNNATQPVYRTGDLVRWDENGEISYIGRKDHQVKIRGFRIELGEIESTLLKQPEIKEAIVVTQGSGLETQIVAYLTINNEYLNKKLEIDSLHARLNRHLPMYMVPNHLITLDEMPINLNGKIDRKKLPEVETNQQQLELSDPMAQEIASVWLEILPNCQGGITLESSFFALGGHSLLAAKLAYQLNESFKADIAISDIFDGPTLAQQVALIRSRSGNRKALVCAPTLDSYPCSPNQERLLIQQEISGSNSQYNMPMVFEIHPDLAYDKVNGALHELLHRHEILRTTYDKTETTNTLSFFNQKIVGTDDWELERKDYYTTTLASDQQKQTLQTLIDQEYEYEFDLFSELPIRLKWIAFEDAHYLIVNINHVACDGESFNTIFNDFNHLVSGERLPNLTYQYKDYAFYLTECGKELKSEGHQYWLNVLEGLPNTSRPIPDQPSYLRDLGEVKVKVDNQTREIQSGIGRKEFTLKGNASSLIDALAEAENTTPFVVFQAALFLTLFKYTNQNQLAIGTPTVNRDLMGTEAMVGYFANTIPLVNQINANQTVKSLIARCKQSLIEGLKHQYVPFDEIVSVAKPERLEAVSPLFQVMLTVNQQDAVVEHPNDSIPVLVPLEFNNLQSKFDIEVEVSAVNNELGHKTWELAVQYNHELYSHELMEGFIECLAKSSVEFTNNLDHQISNINFDFEAHPVNQDLNRQVETTQQSLATIIDQQFENNLNKPFIKSAENAYSYRDIKTQVDRAAINLLTQVQAAGANPKIGIMAEDPKETIVSILAVLKIGGCYVPIDPSYPTDRIELMLEAGGFRHIILGEEVEGAWEAGSTSLPLEVKVISYRDLVTPDCQQDGSICFDSSIDSSIDSSFDSSFESLLEAVTSTHSKTNSDSNGAYMMFTSGSTGTPKGVEVTRANLASYGVTATALYDLQSSHSVLQFSSTSFDIFVEELFTTLFSGATLFLPERSIKTDTSVFWETVVNEKVSLVTLPTAYWHLIVQNLSEDKALYENQLAHLNTVILGGEAMSVKALSLWQSMMPDSIKLLNTYGPTETTVIASFFDATNYDVSKGALPIGQPLENARLKVVNDQGQQVPQGAVGELWIGGQGVAAGYYLDREKTDEKFVSLIEQNGSVERYYRSGDLCLVHSDGHLRFLGRMDHQVKIRGHRVELEEVKRGLERIKGVEESYVTTFEPGETIDQVESSKQLIAYVVANSEQLDARKIKEEFAQDFPSYMTPSKVILLERMPLNGNGKIDVRALPTVESLATNQSQHVEIPVTETEKALASLWSELLKQDVIDRNVDFFTLGGHSLLVAALVKRIKANLNVELKVIDVFNHQTIGKLGEFIDSIKGHHLDAETNESLIAIRQGESELPEVVFVHPLNGHTINYAPLINVLDARIGISALNFDGRTYDSYQSLAHAYGQLLKNEFKDRPVLLVGWSAGGVLAQGIAREIYNELNASVLMLDAYLPENLQVDNQLQRIEMMANDLGLNYQEIDFVQFKALSLQAQLSELLQLAITQGKMSQENTLEDLQSIWNQVSILDQLYINHEVCSGEFNTHLFTRSNDNSVAWKNKIPNIQTTLYPEANHYDFIAGSPREAVANFIHQQCLEEAVLKQAQK